MSLIYIVCILHIDLTLMMESTARVNNCKTRDGVISLIHMEAIFLNGLERLS